jgi:hypothetical protein
MSQHPGCGQCGSGRHIWVQRQEIALGGIKLLHNGLKHQSHIKVRLYIGSMSNSGTIAIATLSKRAT